MRFRLASSSMTSDDQNCYKFDFSENVAGFRRFDMQQLLHGLS